jgi:hypothetical protein
LPCAEINLKKLGIVAGPDLRGSTRACALGPIQNIIHKLYLDIFFFKATKSLFIFLIIRM